MPEDIHSSIWSSVQSTIHSGAVCWNTEIAVELTSIPGHIGQCLADCKSHACLEVGVGDWAYDEYLAHAERMRQTYKHVIAEYNNNRKRTVGLNDISIIALAKTLSLPLIQEEKPTRLNQSTGLRMKIPDVCKVEGVDPMPFNEFLRTEGIKS